MPTCKLCLKDRPHTEEDVMPKWERKIILKRRSAFEPPNANQPKRKVVRLCKECNNRLGKIQDRASVILKPVMQGSLNRLQGDRLQLVALWVLMTDLVIRLCRESQSQGSHPRMAEVQERARRILLEMMDTGEPPESALVCLGRLPNWKTSRFRGRSEVWISSPFWPTTLPDSELADTAVGRHLDLFTVTICVNTGATATALAHQAQHDNRFATLWPTLTEQEPTWPPARDLLPDEVTFIEKVLGFTDDNYTFKPWLAK